MITSPITSPVPTVVDTLRVKKEDIRAVTPGIFIGSNYWDIDELTKHGINAIVNLTEDLPTPQKLPPGIASITCCMSDCALMDGEYNKIMARIKKILLQIKPYPCVLFYCEEGNNKAGLFALATMILCKGMVPSLAMSLVVTAILARVEAKTYPYGSLSPLSNLSYKKIVSSFTPSVQGAYSKIFDGL